MAAVREGILPWARRQRDKAQVLIERIERGEIKLPAGAEVGMTDDSIRTITILRRIIADMEELIADTDG